jgi:two-component system sensor histidine kinase PilS (NtrC family)
VPFLTRDSEQTLRAIRDPRVLLRWVWLGRLSLAAALFVAAVFRWQQADAVDTLIASLTFAAAMIVTVGSAMWTHVLRRPAGENFLYLQCVFDLLLVTAAVHTTGGSTSQFTALYILVIAIASFLLPPGGGLLVAALGNVVYFADVIWGHDTDLTLALWLQLGVFAVVALGSGWLSARVHRTSPGTAELAHELTQVRLQASDILGNIRSGIITIDTKGRLVYANAMAGTLLGLALDEPRMGMPVLEDVRVASPELAAELERSVTLGIRTTRAEGRIRAGGRDFPIGLTTTCIDVRGGVVIPTATAIFNDISDQKRLESLRVRAERLEAVAALSASLAHEIKNPLASIRSAVEQLGGMSAAGEDERTLSTLIVREADRLSRLLTEFLDFARVRATHIGRVDLAEIAREAASLAAAHPDRGEGVHVAISAPDGPVLIEGDDDLLHRAVFNLALNAVQASPERGEVRVEVAPVAQDQLPGGLPDSFDGEDGVVALRVTDQGAGIPAAIRDQMFDPFVTTKLGGTGLGLPVVHRAIEAHRGLVFVDTGSAGTRFTVLLPRTQTAPGGVA